MSLMLMFVVMVFMLCNVLAMVSNILEAFKVRTNLIKWGSTYWTHQIWIHLNARYLMSILCIRAIWDLSLGLFINYETLLGEKGVTIDMVKSLGNTAILVLWRGGGG